MEYWNFYYDDEYVDEDDIIEIVFQYIGCTVLGFYLINTSGLEVYRLY